MNQSPWEQFVEANEKMMWNITSFRKGFSYSQRDTHLPKSSGYWYLFIWAIYLGNQLMNWRLPDEYKFKAEELGRVCLVAVISQLQ